MSYLEIYQTIQLTALSGRDYRVYVPNRELHELFELVLKKENVFMINLPTLQLSSNPATMIINMIRLRRKKNELIKVFNMLEGHDVYFFAVAYCDYLFWLIKYLSKNNTIHYDPAVTISNLGHGRGIKNNFRRYILRWNTGINFIVYNNEGKIYYSIEGDYLKDIKAIVSKIHVDRDKVNNLITKKTGWALRSGHVMLCAGGVIESGYVYADEYISKIDALIDVLFQLFPQKEVALKMHPRFSELRSREKELLELPKYLPASYYFPFYNTIISYSSTTIFEAANIGQKSISLLDYLSPRNIKQKEIIRKCLQNNTKGKIYFPKTIEEIKNILVKKDK